MRINIKSKQIVVICLIVVFIVILLTILFYPFGGYYRTIGDAKIAGGIGSSEVLSIHTEKLGGKQVEFVIDESKDELFVVQIEYKDTMIGKRYRVIQSETVSISQKVAFYDQEQAAAWTWLSEVNEQEEGSNLAWCIVRPEYKMLEETLTKVRFLYVNEPYMLCCKSTNVSSNIHKDSYNDVSKDNVQTHVTKESIFEKQDVKQEVFYDQSDSGYDIPYCLILPKDYNAKKEYPVLLFLHGELERGTDNTSHIFLADTMYETAGDWLENTIFIAPQCPSDSWWELHSDTGEEEKGALGAVRRLLMYVNGVYSCDEERFYVMGYSMGGYGTWNMAAYYHDVFAAAVPICGWWWPEQADVFLNMPIWIYHGASDAKDVFESSQEMYNAIRSRGGNQVRFSALEGVGRNAWDYVATDREMFEWMFSQKK